MSSETTSAYHPLRHSPELTVANTDLKVKRALGMLMVVVELGGWRRRGPPESPQRPAPYVGCVPIISPRGSGRPPTDDTSFARQFLEHRDVGLQ